MQILAFIQIYEKIIKRKVWKEGKFKLKVHIFYVCYHGFQAAQDG